MKKTIATTLAALTALLCPGLGSYAAAGEMVRSAGGAMTRPAAVSVTPASLGSLSVLPNTSGSIGLPSTNTRGVAAQNAIPQLNAAAAQTSSKAAAPEAAKPQAAQVSGSAAPRDGPVAAAQPAPQQGERATRAVDQAQAAAAPANPPQDGPAGSAAFDGADNRKALLLVGTSGSRPFILTEAKRVADELGYKLLLLDKPSARPASQELVPDAHFIPAAIDDHKEENAAAIVEQIAGIAGKQAIEAVVTFLNPYAHLAGDIVDRIGSKGLSGKAVEIAHTKSLARDAMAKEPSIATPARVVHTAEEAVAFFKEQKGGKIVMKPIKGGGSQGVITDLETEKEVFDSFGRLNRELEEFAKRPDAGFFNLDQNPGIMVERQLTGPEVDVELIVQDGKVVFSHVSDNAPMDRPNAVEKNSTYTSVLPKDIQQQLVDGAAKAAAVMGLTSGNLHIEMMMTPDGPRVLEVNARMGGAFVWEFIRDQTGISLVEQGIRAVLGMPVDAGKTPDTTLEARFFIPQATGKIEAIEGLDAIESMPGFIRAKMLHKAGDAVKAAPDDAFDYIGYVGVRGKTYEEAMDRMMAVLDTVKIKIRKADGTLVEQTGAYTHGKVDTLGLLAAEQRPDALERRDKIMYGYLRGQLALIASFAMYYSLFAPVASALAGVKGMGSGRSGYAGALAVFRPLAGVLVERFSTRSILIGAFAARALIWAVVLPAAFFALGGGAAFLGTFVALMFVDGAIVSLNGLVDIDEGGIDLLGKQHHFPVDDALRNKYNTILDGFYSASRVVMAPAMAAVGVYAAGILSSAAAALVVVMALSFAVPALVGMYYYSRYIPAKGDMGPARDRKPVVAEVKEIGQNLGAGFKLAWTNKKIRWRIAFNSIERAIEDSMLFVVLSEFAMKMLAKGNPAVGALYTAALIAVGKLGAMLSAYLMNKRWQAPVGAEAKYPKYKVFFRLAFGGTLSTLLIPLAFHVGGAEAAQAAAAGNPNAFPWMAAGIAALGALLFNLLFASSALGFRNLMQGIVSEQGASGRLFGIQGTILMAVNALAILGISALFATVGLGAAFWIASGIYAVLGAIELFIAPKLLFSKAEREARDAKK